jgi:hypothetical protein
MADRMFNREYRRALERAAAADATEPRARFARFDRRSGRVIVELRNRSRFIFSPELVEGLGGADVRDLARVEVSPSGAGLHWPTLDVDFGLPALMAGVFGSRTWMASLRDSQPKRRARKVSSRSVE